MLHRQAMGNEGMGLAILAALTMALVAFFVGPQPRLVGDLGICLHSPNMWGMTQFQGWIFNAGVLLAAIFTLYLVNRNYNFVTGSDTVLPGMFALLLMSNVWVSGTLTASGLLALANLLCIMVLFGCYRKDNATQELCVIATILSVGTMIQYAFIFMIPVYLVGAIMMKCLRFKSFVAFGLGLVAPYWVAIGLGLVPIESFTWPTMTNLFDGFVEKNELLAGLVNVGLTALVTVILALANMVRLYAGNTQKRLYNMVIYLVGLVSICCIIVDANNMVAYLGTLYLVAAVQLANFFELRNIYYANRWVLGISLLYIAGFIVMMVMR